MERFDNHLPFHRLEKKYAGEGFDLSASTQERSMARRAARLEPLPESFSEQVRGAGVIFSDDTPDTIAQPSGQTGSKRGRFWIHLDREGRPA